jgi:hypothetical protein
VRTSHRQHAAQGGLIASWPSPSIAAGAFFF